MGLLDSSSPRARSPAQRRAELDAVHPASRDAWLDRLLAIDGLPDDEPSLARGCVPYLPCPVDTILAAIDLAAITSADTFVDLGAGLGRVLALVRLVTGARAIGIELQPALVQRSAALLDAARLGDIAVHHGDAATSLDVAATGTVFFLYCPFSGERLDRALAGLATIAACHPIRVCCVDLPLPRRDWLVPVASPPPGSLVVYRSV